MHPYFFILISKTDCSNEKSLINRAISCHAKLYGVRVIAHAKSPEWHCSFAVGNLADFNA